MSATIETPIAALFQQQQTPNRKTSQATTLCSPTSLNKKSFSSSSSRRSSSTPLADRFMSINHYPIVTSSHIEQDDNDESLKEIVFTTPDYTQNDQPLCTPPPLFLSYDPASEIQQYCPSPPPKRNNRPHPCCCSYNRCEKKTRHHQCSTKSHRDSNTCKKKYYKIEEQPKKKRIKSHQVIDMKNNERIMIDNNKKIKEEKEEQQKSRRIGCCFLRKWKEKEMSSSRRRFSGCFCFCGRREWVIFTFISVVLAFILAFVFWPRTPLIRIEGAMRTAPTKVTQTQQGSERMGNVAFESIWLLNITMDNRRNYLPMRFNRIQIFAKDAMTGLLIGKGIQNEFGEVYLPGHTISTIQLPISINYQARERSDTTFSNLLRACTNMTSQEQHHSLPIHFWFTLYIFGLDWLGYKPSLIATPATGGFICPL